MTDATGKSFLSYRSTRRGEAELLIAAQHDHGIPTWRDRKDLAETPTADELHRVLEERFTANAVLWITPDVQDSNVIRKIEVPGILKRVNQADGFFLIPVCAGGIDYKGAAEAVDQQLSADNFEDWNLPKVKGNPIDASEAAEVARRVLKRRISSVNRQLEPGLPLKLTLHTRTPPAFLPGTALLLDWSPRFNNRETSADEWKNILIPALSNVVSIIRTEGGGRAVVANGLASIPAVTALGSAFLAQGGQKISWSQYTTGRTEQLWNLDAGRESTGFVGETKERDMAGTDLAVLLSVADDVEAAFAHTPSTSLPKFRAISRIKKNGSPRFDITSAAQANDIALTVSETLRIARQNYRPLTTIHLFMAVPLGLAMLVGQSLNTFGQVQTYEHIPTDAVGIYRPAARLFPSS